MSVPDGMTCLGNHIKMSYLSKSTSSVQFSLFSQNKLQYKDTYKNIVIVSWQGSPEETRRLMKPGLSSQTKIDLSVDLKVSTSRGFTVDF